MFADFSIICVICFIQVKTCSIPQRFPAKKGLHTLAPKFPDFVVNVGFTIEGRSDEELPGKFSSALWLVSLL
jgi:hypothetical protein